MNFIIGFIIGFLIVCGAMFLWQKGTESNEQHCKQKYGQEYVLYMNKANSSVQACKAPDGTLKEL